MLSTQSQSAVFGLKEIRNAMSPFMRLIERIGMVM